MFVGMAREHIDAGASQVRPATSLVRCAGLAWPPTAAGGPSGPSQILAPPLRQPLRPLNLLGCSPFVQAWVNGRLRSSPRAA